MIAENKFGTLDWVAFIPTIATALNGPRNNLFGHFPDFVPRISLEFIIRKSPVKSIIQPIVYLINVMVM